MTGCGAAWLEPDRSWLTAAYSNLTNRPDRRSVCRSEHAHWSLVIAYGYRLRGAPESAEKPGSAIEDFGLNVTSHQVDDEEPGMGNSTSHGTTIQMTSPPPPREGSGRLESSRRP